MERTKFLIDRNTLSTAIEMASKITGRNKALPVLANVKVDIRAGECSIEAASPELALRRKCTLVSSEGESSFLCDCAALLKYLKLVKSEHLRIVVEGMSLTVEHDNGKCVFPVNDCEQWPQTMFEQHSDETTAMVPSSNFLAKAIADASVFAGHDDFHKNMQHLCIRMTPTSIMYCASDTVRLCLYEEDADCPETAEILVAQETFPLINQLASESSFCNVKTGENSVVFDFGDTKLCQTKFNGKYPDVKRVIPKDCNFTCKVAKRVIAQAMRRISTMASGQFAAKIVATRDHINISATDIDTQKATYETLSCDCDGDFTIGVGSTMFAECVGAFSGEYVEMHIVDRSRPIVLKCEDDPFKTVIVMPMNISE